MGQASDFQFENFEQVKRILEVAYKENRRKKLAE